MNLLELENSLPVAIDFDGVLAVNVYPDPGIGEPIKKNFVRAINLKAQGEKIIIFTARPWKDQQKIERFCLANGLLVDGVICGKLLAKKYVDDKAVNSKSSW